MRVDQETLWETLRRSLDDGTFVTLKLTHPRDSSDESPRRESVRPMLLRNQLACQWELQFTKKQHHLNLSPGETFQRTRELFPGSYQEIHLATRAVEIHAKVSKGRFTGRVTNRVPTAGETPLVHDREKKYLIPEGVPCPFLVALNVMTPAGKVKAKKEKKFRQINRYLELVNDVYPSLPATGPLRVVDFGCGLSYLTFAVHHLLATIHGRTVQLVGIDRNPEVVERCRRLAGEVSPTGLSFVTGSIEQMQDDGPLDLAISLHACDTATDAALEFAVSHNAQVILAAPCCQHELSGKLQSPRLEPLLRHGILIERFAALATDALRAAALDAAGYRTQVLEFIELEHTPKNLLLRGIRIQRDPAATKAALERFQAMKSELGLGETAIDRIVTAVPENRGSE